MLSILAAQFFHKSKTFQKKNSIFLTKEETKETKQPYAMCILQRILPFEKYNDTILG